MRSAKITEANYLSFGLWTWVGPRKHKFNRIRQAAPMCPHLPGGANVSHGRARRLKGRTHWRKVICGGDQLSFPLPTNSIKAQSRYTPRRHGSRGCSWSWWQMMWRRWRCLTCTASWWHCRCTLQGSNCWHNLQHIKHLHHSNNFHSSKQCKIMTSFQIKYSSNQILNTFLTWFWWNVTLSPCIFNKQLLTTIIFHCTFTGAISAFNFYTKTNYDGEINLCW